MAPALRAGPLAAVVLVAAALAVLQDARALAVIGALGGFATPLLVSSGSGNQVALFAYYLVLDLGIAAVAWHKTWRALNLIGFLGTFVVATAWGVLKYQPHHYASSQGFLIAFFLLFVAIMLMPARQRGADGAAHHVAERVRHERVGRLAIERELDEPALGRAQAHRLGVPAIVALLIIGLVNPDQEFTIDRSIAENKAPFAPEVTLPVLFAGAGFLMMLGGGGQAVHDRLSETRVVRA